MKKATLLALYLTALWACDRTRPQAPAPALERASVVSEDGFKIRLREPCFSCEEELFGDQLRYGYCEPCCSPELRERVRVDKLPRPEWVSMQIELESMPEEGFLYVGRNHELSKWSTLYSLEMLEEPVFGE